MENVVAVLETITTSLQRKFFLDYANHYLPSSKYLIRTIDSHEYDNNNPNIIATVSPLNSKLLFLVTDGIQKPIPRIKIFQHLKEFDEKLFILDSKENGGVDFMIGGYNSKRHSGAFITDDGMIAYFNNHGMVEPCLSLIKGALERFIS